MNILIATKSAFILNKAIQSSLSPPVKFSATRPFDHTRNADPGAVDLRMLVPRSFAELPDQNMTPAE